MASNLKTRIVLGLVLASWSWSAATALGAEPASADWDAWRRLPVFHERIMPLDTFARAAARSICGRERPTLVLEAAAAGAAVDPSVLDEAKALFPDGPVRKFDPDELLFSWLVEPERWHRVPFLVAEHKQLREEVLKAPLYDAGGRRLRHVSPWQVENSDELARRWEELQHRGRHEGKALQLTGVDRKVRDLVDAYTEFRMLTFDPAGQDAMRNRFAKRFDRSQKLWAKLAGEFRAAGRLDREDPSGALLIDAGLALDRLAKAVDAPEYELDQADAAAADFRRLSGEMREWFRKHESSAAAFMSADLARQTVELHLTLYDEGNALRLAPAMSLAALEATRTPDDDAPPWLSLQALLAGSDALLEGYPPDKVEAVRQSMAEARRVYVDRSAADRPAKLAAALERFAESIRALGEAIEPARRALPVAHFDERIFAATAYPPPDALRSELFHNRLEPFFWSWVFNLAGLLGLALSFGALRRPMFWLGLGLLAAGQMLSLLGLGLRWHITGLAPLTGTFHTLVFVALCAALLGLWFTVLPLVWPGLRLGWRLSGIPGTPEATPWPLQTPAPRRAAPWNAANVAIVVVRVAAGVAVLLLLARVPGVWEHGYFNLTPQVEVGARLPTINGLVVWLVSATVLLAAVYYLPRAAVAVAAAGATVPYSLARLGAAEPLRQVAARRPIALVGAAVALLAALLAYYAPATILTREIGAPRPILRDNFWLLVHVVTITISYAGGAMAWGLANISLGFYLFGRYRPAQHSPKSGAAGEGGDSGQHVQASAADIPGEDAFTPAGFSASEEDSADWTAASVEDVPAADAPSNRRKGQARAERGPSPGAPAKPALPARRPPEVCAPLAGFTYRAIQVAVLLLAAGTILGAIWADQSWGRFWSWDAKEVFSLVTLFVYMAVLHGRYVGWIGNFGLALGAVLGMSSILITWYGVNFLFGSGLHSYSTGTGGLVPVIIVVVCNWLFAIAAGARYWGETRR